MIAAFAETFLDSSSLHEKKTKVKSNALRRNTTTQATSGSVPTDSTPEAPPNPPLTPPASSLLPNKSSVQPASMHEQQRKLGVKRKPGRTVVMDVQQSASKKSKSNSQVKGLFAL